MRRIAYRLGLIALAGCLVAAAGRPALHARLSISGSEFMLGDEPFTIISGEMHYARVPREYWRDRLLKAAHRDGPSL